MKIAIAGAFGKLGSQILEEAIKNGHEVIALDLHEGEISNKNYTFYSIDVTNKESLKGKLKGVDVLISTVGLTSKSATLTNYDIDYKGNLNLLVEALTADVKKFVYISVVRCDESTNIPMLHSKYLFETALKASEIDYMILRPTGYFYDIVKVFKPMILKGEVSLLGKKDYKCNVVKTSDFARFIMNHLDDCNITYTIGGKETYTYKEIANMCAEAYGKEIKFKYAPKWLFSILAILPKNKKNGSSAIIRFSKFNLTHDMIGTTICGDSSFKEYIEESFGD